MPSGSLQNTNKKDALYHDHSYATNAYGVTWIVMTKFTTGRDVIYVGGPVDTYDADTIIALVETVKHGTFLMLAELRRSIAW